MLKGLLIFEQSLIRNGRMRHSWRHEQDQQVTTIPGYYFGSNNKLMENIALETNFRQLLDKIFSKEWFFNANVYSIFYNTQLYVKAELSIKVDGSWKCSI